MANSTQETCVLLNDHEMNTVFPVLKRAETRNLKIDLIEHEGKIHWALPEHMKSAIEKILNKKI
jgi:hypothetical protein